jgi:hypothetical protein
MQHGDQDQDGKGRFFYYWKPYLIDIASLAKWKFCQLNNSDCSPSLHGTVEPIATWRGVTGKTRWTGQLLRNNVHVPLYRTSVANLSFWVGEYMLANILRGAAANICRSKKINPSLLVSEKLVSTEISALMAIEFRWFLVGWFRHMISKTCRLFIENRVYMRLKCWKTYLLLYLSFYLAPAQSGEMMKRFDRQIQSRLLGRRSYRSVLKGMETVWQEMTGEKHRK